MLCDLVLAYGVAVFMHAFCVYVYWRVIWRVKLSN